MGSAAGVEKAAAARVGLNVPQYRALRAAGAKWCGRCRVWHSIAAFNEERSRGDGLAPYCRVSARGRARGKEPIVKRRARKLIASRVRRGHMPHANTLPCTDCGTAWTTGAIR